MKKSFYVTLSLLIGVVIGMTSTAFAAPVKEYVQASFGKITFIVNGDEKSLDADPLVYQGSTYLPVRAVLNALGYDVGYKADTKTVIADKDVDTVLLEVSALIQKEGQPMETTIDTQDIDKQIESLNKSIETNRELIKTLEEKIQEAQSRSDASDDVKKSKIEQYNKMIETSNKMITIYEEKLTKLQK